MCRGWRHWMGGRSGAKAGSPHSAKVWGLSPPLSAREPISKDDFHELISATQNVSVSYLHSSLNYKSLLQNMCLDIFGHIFSPIDVLSKTKHRNDPCLLFFTASKITRLDQCLDICRHIFSCHRYTVSTVHQQMT